MKNRKLLGLLLVLATLVLMEGGAWIALAVMGPGPAPISIEWSEGDQGQREELRDLMYVPDGDLFFRLKPNLVIETTPSDGVLDVHTDGRGYRVVPGEQVAGGQAGRVLCVGDSCTFGWGAAGTETFPAQLAQRLEGYEVINTGVPGYSSYQGRQLLAIEGWDLEPDVVTFTFGYNDACVARGGGTKRNMPKGEVLSDSAYGARLQGPSPFRLVRLVERLRKPRAAATPGEKGKKAKGERVATTRVSAAEYRANLEWVADECERRGVRLVLIVWPLKAIGGKKGAEDSRRITRCHELQQIVREVAADRGTLLVDLVPIAAESRGLFVDRVHFNGRGYGIVADEIARVLSE